MKESEGRRPRPWTRIATLTVAVLYASCGGQRDPALERVRRAQAGSGDLVVAAAWPWELRKELRYAEGLQLGVDEFNAAGGLHGRKLRLAKYDDHESINHGGVVAQQIAADPDVVAVIGHLQSYVTVQAAGVYDQAGLVHLAPTSTDPQLTGAGKKRLFRATFTDASVGRQLADFAASQGWKRVAIYYIRNDYGRNVANAFEARAGQAGVTIQGRNSYDASEQAGERTFEQAIADWQAAEVDALVLAGEVPSAAIFVAQARKQGIRVPILGGDAMSSPALIAIAGAAAEGTIVASFFHPDEPRPAIARFMLAFVAKYGVEPDAGSALGYDCIRLIAEGLRRANSAVPADLAKALHQLVDWEGVTANFTFDAKGDMTAKPVVMSVVRDGKFAMLRPGDLSPALLKPARP